MYNCCSLDIQQANPYVEEYYVDVNQPMKSGYTALHLAVMYASLDVVRLLMSCQPIVKEG